MHAGSSKARSWCCIIQRRSVQNIKLWVKVTGLFHAPPPPPQTIQFVTILNKIIKKSENLTLDHRCSPLSFSALWQHSADGDHFIHGQRTSQNRRQSVGALRVHKTTGVPETRYADGFPRRSNESRRHHRQHVAPSNEQTGSEIKTEDPPQQTPF